MTAAPAIYDGLTDGARAAYGRWIMALFGRTAHVDSCPFGCQDNLPRCSDGERYVAAERQRWSEWHAIRRQEQG